MITRRWRPGAAIGLMGALLTWEYAPVLHGAFVYEDMRLTDACGLQTHLRFADPVGDPRAFVLAVLSGRRVTQLSWCWQLAQAQPLLAFHLMNLGLHSVTTGLVGALIWRLSRSPAVSLLGAMVFGLNAVAVEAVAYLSGRSEIIAAIGVLAACLAAVYRRWWLIAPSLLIGLGGKESAIVAVVLVPLTLWYTRGSRWGLVTLISAEVLAWVVLARTVLLWRDVSPIDWILTQTSAIVRVTLLAIMPIGQTVDYDYARVPMGIKVLACGAVLAAIVAAWRSQRRLVWFGAWWMLCAAGLRMLVPTPRSVFPEHQFYLPLVGMSFVLAGLLGQESPRDDYRPAL